MTPEQVVSRIDFTKVSMMSFEGRVAERAAIAADIRMAISEAIAEQREADAKIADQEARAWEFSINNDPASIYLPAKTASENIASRIREQGKEPQ